jgi:hypothetical protein
MCVIEHAGTNGLCSIILQWVGHVAGANLSLLEFSL